MILLPALPALPRRRLALALSALAFFPAVLAQSPDAARPPDVRLREVQADPQLAEHYQRIGRKVAAFCANCHGERGNSVKPDVPNLAGQNTAYLLEQVRQFSDGRRRNMFMEGLMKAMSNDEKIGVALYYATQPVAPQPVRDAALAARGKAYYDRICWRCHGAQGQGSEGYARIAGQQQEYLAVTLKRYRDGSATRADPLMAANTKAMSDDDIRAVAAYVASMQ